MVAKLNLAICKQTRVQYTDGRGEEQIKESRGVYKCKLGFHETFLGGT